MSCQVGHTFHVFQRLLPDCLSFLQRCVHSSVTPAGLCRGQSLCAPVCCLEPAERRRGEWAATLWVFHHYHCKQINKLPKFPSWGKSCLQVHLCSLVENNVWTSRAPCGDFQFPRAFPVLPQVLCSVRGVGGEEGASSSPWKSLAKPAGELEQCRHGKIPRACWIMFSTVWRAVVKCDKFGSSALCYHFVT